ncbi:MAG: amidohydrolase family protein [Phycisphaerae bacterium]|nr:amidohydrolase family protein [Phycisphaerae bacterium]
MIVDCHAHIWEATSQLGRCAEPARTRIYASAGKSAGSHDLQIASAPVDVCFVLGFRSRALGVDIPNKFIADCACQYQDKVMGFGSVDPVHDNVPAEADRIRRQLHLAGFVVSPAGQGFHPTSTDAMKLYDYAADHRMPVIVHQGPPFGTPFCEFSNPVLWSSVCREYRDLRFVFTDMGWPWTDQSLLMAAEYENVYIDLAGLVHRPWVAYDLLVKCYQMGLVHKLLLASDYPAAGAAAAIEAIYSINQLVGSTNFPSIPRQKLRDIVESNTLEKLGLENKWPGHVQKR